MMRSARVLKPCVKGDFRNPVRLADSDHGKCLAVNQIEVGVHADALCVLAENQWTACKRAEEHLKKHFYYNKGELIFLELHQIYDPESVSNASIEFIP